MPKKKPVNKSQIVREYIAANPDMGPTDLSALIKRKEKLAVAPTFISNVSTRLRAASKPKRKKAAAKKQQPQSQTGLDAILSANDLIEKLGGVDAAQDALNAAKKIRDRIG